MCLLMDLAERYEAAFESFVRRAVFFYRGGLNTRTSTVSCARSFVYGSGPERGGGLGRRVGVRVRLEMITQPNGGVDWFVSAKVPVKTAGGEIIALASTSRDLRTPVREGRELGWPLYTSDAAGDLTRGLFCASLCLKNTKNKLQEHIVLSR